MEDVLALLVDEWLSPGLCVAKDRLGDVASDAHIASAEGALGAPLGQSTLRLETGMVGTGKTTRLRERAEAYARAMGRRRMLLLDLGDERLPQRLDRRVLVRAFDAYFERVPEARHQPFAVFLDNVGHVDGWVEFVSALMDAYRVRVWAADACAHWLSPAFRARLPQGAVVLGRPGALGVGGVDESSLAAVRKTAVHGVVEDVLRKNPAAQAQVVLRVMTHALAHAGERCSVAGLARLLADEGVKTTRETVSGALEGLADAHIVDVIPRARVGGDGAEGNGARKPAPLDGACAGSGGAVSPAPRRSGNPRAASLVCAGDAALVGAFARESVSPERTMRNLVGMQLRGERMSRGLGGGLSYYRSTSGAFFGILTEEGELVAPYACALGGEAGSAGDGADEGAAEGAGGTLPPKLQRAVTEAMELAGASEVTLVVTQGSADLKLACGMLHVRPLDAWLAERALPGKLDGLDAVE